MKIIKLTAENIKRLKAVEITPDSNVVVISGKNGQGKSSVLDAILYALGGKADIDERPIRNGEDHAKIELDLGQLQVKRTFTDKGTYLEVTNKEGFKAGSPQMILNTLVGKISFDPLSFVQLEPKALRQMLLDLVDINIDTENLEIKKLQLERQSENQNIKQLSVEVDGFPTLPNDLPDEQVSTLDAVKAITDARKHNEDYSKKRQNLENMQEACDRQEAYVADLTAKLENAKRILVETTEQIRRHEAELDQIEPLDLKPLEDKVAQIDQTNKLIAQKIEQSKTRARLDAAKNHYHEMGNRIKVLEQIKHKRLAEVTMPIKGLAVTDDGVEYNNVPITQISSSERLRVGIAIGMAQNPKLRVLRITDGSLLDEHNLAAISQMVTDRDFQIWIERVDSSGQCGIIIEDGSIVEQKGGDTPKEQPVVEAVNLPAN